MRGPFAAIGFEADDADDLAPLMATIQAAARTRRLGLRSAYAQWSDPSGAELWLRRGGFGRTTGVVPHFAGSSEMKIRLAKRVEPAEGGPLDGGFYGWVNPKTEAGDSGDSPLVFDAPDAQLHRGLALPATVTVQLAAFPYEIEAFDSEEDYYASQDRTDLAFAARSFIPSGLFTPDGDVIDPPEPFCVMTGIIIEADVRMNALTQQRFHWVLIDTLGGVVDVVCAPVDLPGPPRPGAVVHGTFRLSGRIQKRRNGRSRRDRQELEEEQD
jgi:hypothetical protein